MTCWHGDFSRGVDSFAPKMSGSQQNRRNCSCVLDPTGSGAVVACVSYGAGTTSPSADLPGGANFYAYPYGTESIGDAVRLEYELFLCPDWEFNKGGKLPGLNGGKQGVSGGHHDDDGFSVRLMWRRGGKGEAYLYVPVDAQVPEFARHPPQTKVDGRAGVSFARGAWTFVPGRWTSVAITVRLNSCAGGVPRHDGVLRVDVDGETKIRFDRLVWRKNEGIHVDNIFFSTFYGGGDPSWAPAKDNWALFRNFKVHRLSPKPCAT